MLSHCEYVLMFLFVTSISLLSRCIPDLSYLISQHLTFVRHFFDIIDVHDLITKFLADISTAWREILALCGIAIGKHLHICVVSC